MELVFNIFNPFLINIFYLLFRNYLFLFIIHKELKTNSALINEIIYQVASQLRNQTAHGVLFSYADLRSLLIHKIFDIFPLCKYNAWQFSSPFF